MNAGGSYVAECVVNAVVNIDGGCHDVHTSYFNTGILLFEWNGGHGEILCSPSNAHWQLSVNDWTCG